MATDKIDKTVGQFSSDTKRDRYMAVYQSFQESQWPSRDTLPSEDTFIDTSYGKTYVLSCGDLALPPLVLLHGFNGTSLMWAPNILDLTTRYRCHCVQIITDVGRSVQTAPIKSAEHYVDWMDQVLDGLSLRNDDKANSSIRLAGMSYGGWLAALYTLHRPGVISHLCLMCPAGTLMPINPMFFVRAMLPLLTKSASLIRGYWRWFLHKKHLITHPITDLFVAEFQNFSIPRDFVQSSVFTDDELRKLCANVQRISVIVGDHEVIYKGGHKRALERFTKMVPEGGVARVFVVQGASHAMSIDNQEQTSQFMLEALE